MESVSMKNDYRDLVTKTRKHSSNQILHLQTRFTQLTIAKQRAVIDSSDKTLRSINRQLEENIALAKVHRFYKQILSNPL